MTSTAVAALVVAFVALVVAVAALLQVRRATRALAVALAERPVLDDVDWQLQWIEPGVYFLSNTSPAAAALQVEVSSSLTPVAGGSAATATVQSQRVNPGAWVEVRHPSVGQGVFADLEQLRRSTALIDELRHRLAPLDTLDLAALAAADEQVYDLHDRVEYTLSYTVSWRTPGGTPRLKTPVDQRLVPSPSAL